VLDGRIYHGRTGAAAEGGAPQCRLSRVPSADAANEGCIEVFAAGPAIARRARTKLAEGLKPPVSCTRIGQRRHRGRVTSETIGQAYEAGDPLATEVLQETIAFLAHWLGNIVDFLEPDVMVIGGGVALMLSPFFDEIKNQLPDCCVNSRCQEIPLVMARYGADGGHCGRRGAVRSNRSTLFRSESDYPF